MSELKNISIVLDEWSVIDGVEFTECDFDVANDSLENFTIKNCYFDIASTQSLSNLLARFNVQLTVGK